MMQPLSIHLHCHLFGCAKPDAGVFGGAAAAAGLQYHSEFSNGVFQVGGPPCLANHRLFKEFIVHVAIVDYHQW